jgi:hypothetical protein
MSKAKPIKRILQKSWKPGLFLLILLTGLTGCFKETEKCAFIPPVENKVELKFDALTDSILSIESKDELVTFLGRHTILRDYFLKRSQYPNDSVFVNELYRRFTHPAFDTLRMEAQKIFGDERALQEEFNQAFSNLRFYYPEAKMPRIETVITGLDTDLYVSDSLIIVGLDYYLGPDAKYRPNMYDYLLRQYRKENIVPSIMLLLGMVQYNASDLTDETVLADMVAYGKSFYFAKHMLPCTADSIFIWYSEEEIKGAQENQDLIWYRLIEDQVLYSTSHVMKQRYLGERPFTIEVGEKCPGRIAQWVGWQIVMSYMNNHPDVTLPELMLMMDADRLFKESRYKPVKR